MIAEDGSTPPAGMEVTRFIPIPTSVSAQAQEFLTVGLGLLAGGTPEEPALDDLEGWRNLISASNEMVGAILGAKADALGSTVDTTTVGGVPVFVVTPTGVDDDHASAVYLDLHGGGFIIGSGDTCRVMARNMAEQVQMELWSVDYRMPPDHPYPAALDDCMTVYRHLLDEHPPERIVVGGASAGGNLAAALVLRARDEGLPLPAAVVLLTPEADLTESGDSFATNMGIDAVLTASLAGSIALYADGHDLTDPYLSPLFGDFSPSFPPTLLQAGTRDLFLSNTVRLHRKLREAGVDAELHVFEAMPHGGFFGAPEDDEIGAETRRFVTKHLTRDAEPVVVNHIGLCVTDLARSQRFYEDVLGFVVDRVLRVPDAGSGPLLAVDPPVNLHAVYLDRGPFVLELLHFDRAGNPDARTHEFNRPGLTHLSFSVADLDATLARVPAAGGEVITNIPGVVAMIRDPDGQSLELLPMDHHRRLVASRNRTDRA